MSELIFNKISSPPSGINTGESAITVDSTSGEPQYTDGNTGLTKTFKSIYGSNYHVNENTTPSTNTTTSFQNYLTLSYSMLDDSPSAIYKVNIFFVWGYSVPSRDYRGIFSVNGTQYGEEFRVEPKDGGSDQRNWATGWYTFTGAELGVSGTIEFDFASQSNGDTSRTYTCNLELLRVK